MWIPHSSGHHHEPKMSNIPTIEFRRHIHFSVLMHNYFVYICIPEACKLNHQWMAIKICLSCGPMVHIHKCHPIAKYLLPGIYGTHQKIREDWWIWPTSVCFRQVINSKFGQKCNTLIYVDDLHSITNYLWPNAICENILCWIVRVVRWSGARKNAQDTDNLSCHGRRRLQTPR
jgi:hypothetical protein